MQALLAKITVGKNSYGFVHPRKRDHILLHIKILANPVLLLYLSIFHMAYEIVFNIHKIMHCGSNAVLRGSMGGPVTQTHLARYTSASSASIGSLIPLIILAAVTLRFTYSNGPCGGGSFVH